MTVRRDPNAQFDFFIPLVRDLPLKDQRETMERPFFSLQKRKRLKPIEYRSGDGEVWVKVEAVPAYGMATIWDADILIWASSSLNRLKSMGRNDLPRELRTTTYDLLRSIRRDTGGKGYQELRAALDRLSTTTIFTSIRAKRGRDSRFSWLDSWEVEVDPVSEKLGSSAARAMFNSAPAATISSSTSRTSGRRSSSDEGMPACTSGGCN